VATDFRFLGAKPDSIGGGARSAAAGASDFGGESHGQADHEQAGPEVTDEDIPF
jgi:hypothetical protein